MKISEKARTLLAEEYERHGKYLTYAQQAMTSDVEFTMCSLRAIERALAPQPPSVGDADVKRYVRGPEKMEAYSQGDWVSYSDYAARDQQIARLRLNISEMNDEAKLREEQIAELQARVAELEDALVHVRDKIRQSDVSWGTGLLIDEALAQQVTK